MTNIPDWLAALGILAPATTGLGGYWLAGRNEEARDKRAAAREVENRRTKLAERLDESKHTFQRDLLLELQDVLQRQVRATAKVLLHDKSTLLETGSFSLLGDDLNQECYNIGVNLNRLLVRVLDDTLRQHLEEFHIFSSKLEISLTQIKDVPVDKAIQFLEDCMHNLNEKYMAVNSALGDALRSELGRSPDKT